jgi:hypothetical protein
MQERGQGRTFLKAIMDLRVPEKVEICWRTDLLSIFQESPSAHNEYMEYILVSRIICTKCVRCAHYEEVLFIRLTVPVFHL